jgi:hypothetical protein
MSVPTDRASFVAFCRRQCGEPVIQLNVDPLQVDDVVDQALQFYYDYHYDGSDKTYIKHQVTANDVISRSIPVPANVIGVVQVFDIGYGGLISGSVSGDNLMFTFQYQYALDAIAGMGTTGIELTPYYLTRLQMAGIQEMLIGKQPIRYNRHMDTLFIDMDWGRVPVGQYIIIEAYQVIDPNVFPKVWSDRWLQEYVSAKIRRVWGMNLTKFVNMQLPGSLQFNGEKILSDANQEITDLETKMIEGLSLPCSLMTG